MNKDYRFSELVYEPTDYEAVRTEMEAVTGQVKAAASVEELLSAIEAYDKIKERVNYAGTLCYIRMSQDSADPGYAKAANAEFAGASMLPEAEFAKAVLESRFMPGLEERFGKEYRLRLEKNFRLKRAGLELIAQEGELVNEYQRKNATLRIPFRGKEYSQGEMRRFAESPDREVRKAALKATLETLQGKKDEYIGFLKKILHVRDGIAKANGFTDYAAYMDTAYDRSGYGKKELEEFCAGVKKTLVPLLQELLEKQAKRLGLESVRRYDLSVFYPDGNPAPAGGVDALTDAAAKMYDSLSPELGAFFRDMIRTESFDIAPSGKKVNGMGFETSLNRNYFPFVFANCNGTASDEELTAKARELEHAYWPGVEGDELEVFYQEGIDLFRKMTLYMFPCYGIGYALSWICAMQFYERFCRDKEQALEEYDEFCSRGGSLSYPGLLRTVGMQPPYMDGVVEDLVSFAKKELRELEKKI